MLAQNIRLFGKALFMSALVAVSLTSCDKDDNDDDSYTVPSAYNFDNASYSGQVSRLNMMEEMTSYMKTGNTAGTTVDASQLKAMYANDGFTWTSDAFGAVQPTKQLKNKTVTGQDTYFENWMDKLAQASESTVAGSNGVAGVLSSNDGAKNYLMDENGYEPTQIIEKGLMGAVFYYQGTSVYLSDEQIDVENDVNEEGKDYTAMQHHWDESFGYFGAPTELNSSNINDLSLRFYAKYIKKANDAGLGTVDALMNDGFTKGRAAIDNKDYDARDAAIATVRAEWEMVLVTTGLHYINGAIDDYADDALRNHQLSEAYSFIRSLKYNSARKITDAQVDAVLAKMGANFYETSTTDLDAARTELAAIYSLTATDF